MSEYWKSTPKYWCKHCKTYVRDTKLEKQNHEATPKHQGNLKRFLRDLHRGHERDEREKQRAKDEVARLNGTSTGVSGTSAKLQASSERKPVVPIVSGSKLQQATPAERKQQMARLAEMGIAIPEEFRREMAMPGDWLVTSQRAVYDDVKKEEENNKANVKPKDLNRGVRKRKHENEEEEEDEEDAGASTTRRAWGTTTLTYPTDGDDDLDALLTSTTNARWSTHPYNTDRVQQETELEDPSHPTAMKSHLPSEPMPPAHTSIKREESSDDINHISVAGQATPNTQVKQESPEVPEFVFKKRKPKAIRQK